MTAACPARRGRRPEAGSGSAAIRHDRFGRRRQVDAHRTPALRHQTALRRPARGRHVRIADGAARMASTSPSSPTGYGPNASRASRSMSPTATPPTPTPEVRHRRLPWPRPVHAQHGHRRLHCRPGSGRRRRTAGLREQTRRHICIAALLGVASWWSAPTRWTWSVGTRRPTARRRRDGGAGPPPRDLDPHGDPDLALLGDNVADVRTPHPGTTDRPCSTRSSLAQAGGWAAQHGAPRQRRRAYPFSGYSASPVEDAATPAW